MMEEKIPDVGVASYALMAAGGDLGASVAPQIMGVVADKSGLQTGMLVSAIFPILGIVLMLVIIRLVMFSCVACILYPDIYITNSTL